MRRAIFAALMLGMAMPAVAAQPAAPPPAPAPAAPAIDPAQLAAAERLVDLIMPAGMFRQILEQSMTDPQEILSSVTAADLGLEGAGGDRSLAEAGAAADPAFAERLRIATNAMQAAMIEVIADMEPEMKRLYVQFFARRYTSAEIGEMTAFFSSPTGQKYARIAVTMAQDPVYLELMRAMAPRFAGLYRRLAQSIRDATAHLPPPPRPRRNRR